MEAAAEATEIAERGMKEATEEAEVKFSAARTAVEATNCVSSDIISSASTSASTAAYAFARAPTSTGSVIGISRRSGYT